LRGGNCGLIPLVGNNALVEQFDAAILGQIGQ